MTATDTVHDRLGTITQELSPATLAAGLLFAAALGYTLVFMQDPLAHDAMHSFRHAAGITCH